MEASVRERILSILAADQTGRQVEEVAAELGMTRHTVAKYLEIMHAEGRLHFQKAGRAKIWKRMSTASTVRLLTLDDLDDILRIQTSIEREHGLDDPDRIEFLSHTVRYHLEKGEPLINLGVEVEGVLRGFVLAETRFWEFGRGERTGWIKVLGVDPQFQSRGIGRKLGGTLMNHFERLGVRKVRTLVDWYEGGLISYFKSLGFDMLNMIPLEKEIGT